MEKSKDEFRILGRPDTGENAGDNVSEKETMGGIIFNIPEDKTVNIIKVIGVGGGGSNAVRNMYNLGVTNVNFAICNTDSQALSKSPVPMKVQLGSEGLGVGGVPEIGREKAEESLEDIEMMLGKDTQMLFLTAGMGGGTGTGAAPIIAHAARERGILTIGVVTLPFAFEKRDRCEKALLGIDRLKREVDSLLVINNERLLEIYSGENGISIDQAFEKADNILTTATKSIAEIITLEGIVNRDFNDVKTVMKDGGSAIMSVGYGEGENRIMKAMKEALHSPLLCNMAIEKSRRLLYIIYSCKEAPVMTNELTQVNQFMDTLSDDLEVLWGLYPDDTLGEQVKVAIVATGFDSWQDSREQQTSEDETQRQRIAALKQLYYGHPEANKPLADEAPEEAEPIPETEPLDVDTPSDDGAAESRQGKRVQFNFQRIIEQLESLFREE